jgi:hypothetical protein
MSGGSFGQGRLSMKRTTVRMQSSAKPKPRCTFVCTN